MCNIWLGREKKKNCLSTKNLKTVHVFTRKKDDCIESKSPFIRDHYLNKFFSMTSVSFEHSNYMQSEEKKEKKTFTGKKTI